MSKPSPSSPAEVDAYAQNYDAALNEGLALTGEAKEFFAVGRVAWLKRRLEQSGVNPAVCLDFGCGTGTSAGYLVGGLGLQSYIGFDPSADSITHARLRQQQCKDAALHG